MASSAQKEPRRSGSPLHARCQLLREVYVPGSTLWWEDPPSGSIPIPYPQEESSDVPLHPVGPRPAAGLTGLSLSLTRGCAGGPIQSRRQHPSFSHRCPSWQGGASTRQDSHAHSDQVEGQRTAGQTLPLMCTGLRKQPGLLPSMPRVPGDERPREVRAPEGDSGPAWDHLQWSHYALSKPSQPPSHVLCAAPHCPPGLWGPHCGETAVVSFPPFPVDPAQDFSALELEARGYHLAEMALPSHWSLQSPACEPSTSPAVRRPGCTHGARACWLFTNPLAASLWRCSSKNTPNRCPQGVPAKGRAAAESDESSTPQRQEAAPRPNPAHHLALQGRKPRAVGCAHRYTHLPMGTAFYSH